MDSYLSEASQITWPKSADPSTATSQPLGQKSYAEYSSSPGAYRGFCTTCGSTLLWRSDKHPEDVGITTGTIDEEMLIGRSEGCDGPRAGTETGKALASPEAGHLWFENAIKGVTDQATVGRKFAEGFDGAVLE